MLNNWLHNLPACFGVSNFDLNLTHGDRMSASAKLTATFRIAIVGFALLWLPQAIANNAVAGPQGHADVRMENALAAQPDGVQYDPTLSKRWLNAEVQRGRPLLVIGRDEEDKLLAGFQARSGKRLLYRATSVIDGLVLAEVLHLNPDTARVERLFDQSTDIDPETGKRMHDFNVNGTNLLAHLKAKRDKRHGLETGTANLASFLDRETGEAFLVGTSALYAVLEETNESEKKAALRKHFGMWAMLLQLGGGRYKGLPDLDRFLGNAKYQRLAAPCETENCELRGRTFVMRKSGFFDVLSKPRGGNAYIAQGKTTGSAASSSLARTLMKSSGPSESAVHQKSIEECLAEKRGDLNFGKCGTGSGIIEPKLPECQKHDWCDCRFGAARCLVTTPDECADDLPEECASLLQAAIAVAAHMFGEVFGALATVIDFVARLLTGTLASMFGAIVGVLDGIFNGVLDAITFVFDFVFGEPDPCRGMYSVECP